MPGIVDPMHTQPAQRGSVNVILMMTLLTFGVGIGVGVGVAGVVGSGPIRPTGSALKPKPTPNIVGRWTYHTTCVMCASPRATGTITVSKASGGKYKITGRIKYPNGNVFRWTETATLRGRMLYTRSRNGRGHTGQGTYSIHSKWLMKGTWRMSNGVSGKSICTRKRN